MEKRRLEYIDAIKGLAIFLMVMGHVLPWSFEDFYAVRDNGPYSASFWWRVIYAFHMPLFFCVSGFLYGKKGNLGFNEGLHVIWKRVRTLLVPFICVGLLFHFTTGGPITKYWFLRTLFIVTFINVCYDFVRTKLRLGTIWDILFYMVSFIVLFIIGRHYKDTLADEIFGLKYFGGFNYLAFCLGIVIRRYDKIKVLIENNATYSLCLAVFIILLFPLSVPKIVTKFLMCFSGIVCVWYLMKYIFTDGAIVHLMRKYGRHSLDIYLAHFFLNISIVEVGAYFVRLASGDTYFSILTGCMLQLIYSVGVSFLICSVCLLVAKIFKSGKIGVLLFGKA